MWDERLTTVEAERTLIENKVRREDRKKYIDQIAAVFILQGYLDSVHLNNDDAECLILKDTSGENQSESVYEIVEDDVELSAVLKVFEELLEDVEIER